MPSRSAGRRSSRDARRDDGRRVRAVKLTFDGQIAVISYDRPEKHNAANDAMDRRLFEILAELQQRPGLRAVVWRGEGASFSSGRDTSQLGVRSEPISDFEFIERGHRGTQLSSRCRRPRSSRSRAG